MKPLQLFVLMAVGATYSVGETIETPRSSDPALSIDLFAQEPMIKHPIGIAIDRDGRLLAIQSNTHFPPKNYDGPKHDRILWLRDVDGDGKADQSSEFFEGTDMTMDIVLAPDGSVVVSTRNEIMRLHDDDRDGKADRADRRLVFLESKASYPHNGVSGLAFDRDGGLFFGIGENLGETYTLTASDGSKYVFNAEGGNVFHVNKDFGALRRVATGFWNPFGVCVDSRSNVFATDNDPDSRPPCRLHHIIEGGDYGYQFRYGRSGLHPFDAWNGELPGTLPMLSGLGEAPCDIIEYEPPMTAKEFRGLPAAWHGQLLVASWSDHAIESYRLPDREHPFDVAKKSVLVQGGLDFRPVGLAVAADGSLFVSDWVKRNYELHGFGRIWRVKSSPQTVVTVPPRNLGIDEKSERIESILRPIDQPMPVVKQWLAETNPWLFSAAITRISGDLKLAQGLAHERLESSRQRAGLLLVAQRIWASSNSIDVSPENFLGDSDPTVRLLALKWIADDRIVSARGAVEKLLTDPSDTPAIFYGAVTALGRIESSEIKEADMVARLKQRIADQATPPKLKRMAIEIMPDRDRNFHAHDIPGTEDAEFREWLMHVLGSLRDGARETALRTMAWDEKQTARVRAAAIARLTAKTNETGKLIGFAQSGEPVVRRAAVAALQMLPLLPDEQAVVTRAAEIRGRISTNRPPFQDVEAWAKFIAAVPGKADPLRGREVFLDPHLGSCVTCHRMDGIGNIAGPNLSTIGASRDGAYILESLLQPNRNIAPQYEAFLLTTADGQARLAFQLGERDALHTYVGIEGKTFEVRMDEVVRRERLPMSIMPEGIANKLTDEEIRDLLAFLESRK